MTFTNCFYIMIVVMPLLIGLSDLMPDILKQVIKGPLQEEKHGKLVITVKGGFTLLMIILTMCVISIQRVMNKRLNKIIKEAKKETKKLKNSSNYLKF